MRVYAEYNGASFKKNIDHRLSCDHFYVIRFIVPISTKQTFLINSTLCCTCLIN